MIRRETIEHMAESLGYANLTPLAVDELVKQCEKMLYELLDQSLLYMRHTYRTELLNDDINHALRLRNADPLYGYHTNATSQTLHLLKNVPAAGGNNAAADDASDAKSKQQSHSYHGEYIYYLPDPTLKVDDLLHSQAKQSLYNIPADTTFSVQWLAVEGIQPDLPHMHTSTPQDSSIRNMFAIDSTDQSKGSGTQQKKRRVDTGTAEGSGDVVSAALLNQQLMTHMLSQEQQLYYQHVTTILSQLPTSSSNDIATAPTDGSASTTPADVTLQRLVLRSISSDDGLQPIVPYLTAWISTSVAENLNNLYFLSQTLLLINAMLINIHINIEPYLHQLLPSILTCVLSAQLGTTISEDHWQVRSNAASLMAKIVQQYGRTYNTLQPRITKLYVTALLDTRKSLTTHYGAVVGIRALGTHVTQQLLMPYVQSYVTALEPLLYQQPTAADINPQKRVEATRVYYALLLAVGDVIRSIGLTRRPRAATQVVKARDASAIPPAGDVQQLEQAVDSAMASGADDEADEASATDASVKQQTISTADESITQDTLSLADLSVQWPVLYDMFGESLLLVCEADVRHYKADTVSLSLADVFL